MISIYYHVRAANKFFHATAQAIKNLKPGFEREWSDSDWMKLLPQTIAGQSQVKGLLMEFC
jgi:hypothetical protein